VLEHVASHLGLAAAEAVRVAEAPEQLRGGVPLLGRGLHIVQEDRVIMDPENWTSG
jgi:hypothetical protein